jgi:maleylacetoacetate isomerase
VLKLYTYFRSSSAYRVRIALNLKQVEYESVFVHLVRDGGEHKKPDYLNKNPQGLVPLLEIAEDAGTPATYLSQSLAMMEYLEEVYPEPALLPENPLARARVRSLTQTVVSEIQPLNNLRVPTYLVSEFKIKEEQKLGWTQHWVKLGFTALEKMLVDSPQTDQYCHGDTPTIADCCLIPQVYNAQRFNCPMEDYPTIQRINENCLALPAFSQAAPENQDDANS